MRSSPGEERCSWAASRSQLREMGARSWWRAQIPPTLVGAHDEADGSFPREVCGGCGAGNTSRSAFLRAPRGFLLLEVENAESCGSHDAYTKSPCPHSVICCPSFRPYFDLASGLLFSWRDTVCAGLMGFLVGGFFFFFAFKRKSEW